MDDQKAFNLAARSLKAFSLLFWPGFEVAPHHQLIIDKLELLVSGRIKKLAVVLPPRHGKTTLASILLPAYFLGRNPRGNVITASYGAELSEGWGRRVRGIIQDESFARVFPDCMLSPDSQAAGRFNTTQNGQYISTGRGGPLTGRGADLLVLDDLIKDAEEARSEIICKGIVEWLKHVALTRLSRDGKIVAISTRWSEKDPMGWLLKEQRGWEIVHLPAICEGAGDLLRRPAGAALWESQCPLNVLESIRVAVGPQVWQSLYQGNPTAAQGMVFKRQWFRHYHEAPEKFEKLVQSWDTAFKTGASNDFSVATTWGKSENGIYLLHLWRDRVEFPELKRQVALQAEQWKPHTVLVEDKASGQSLIQELKLATTFPVIAVKADTDKETRASAVTAYFESGKVLFPEGAAWLAGFEDELAGFPGAVHDDCVDSLTQALNYLRDTSGVLGWIEYIKNVALGVFQPPPEAQESRPTELINKVEMLRFEQKLLGIQPVPISEMFKDPPSPACPFCASSCTIKLGGCPFHCNSCGKNFGDLPKLGAVSRGDLLSGRVSSKLWRM